MLAVFVLEYLDNPFSARRLGAAVIPDFANEGVVTNIGTV